MTIFLQVSPPPDVQPGDVLAVGGVDDHLGAWEPARAVRLQPCGEAGAWACELPMPSSSSSEFKLLHLRGEDARWETLPANRRFPTTGLHAGSTLRLVFAEARMSIEANQAQIEANARAHRKVADRQGSALEADLNSKGDNAYYYAHSRHYEVPADAKVISGPGLITGGTPVLLESSAEAVIEEKTVMLKEYSWSDGKGKVKVYVPVPEGVLPPEGAAEIVQAVYGPGKVDLIIAAATRHRLTIEKLNGEVDADSSSLRVEAHKSRVVIQMAKKRETTWYNLTKGK